MVTIVDYNNDYNDVDALDDETAAAAVVDNDADGGDVDDDDSDDDFTDSATDAHYEV